ncbi:MAG: dipeptide epimerase [Elusimicrobia bacterium]|nr:dipeptide epimerase [Elusimicrobiota bacterium]
MKETIIKKVRVRKLHADLFMPFTVSSGSHARLENILFEAELKGGIKGFGEAALANHITGETQSLTFNNLKKAAVWFEGKDIADYFKLFVFAEQKLDKNRCALAAVEMAILDALTKSLNIPLWKFYGDKCEKIKSDITLVIGGEKNNYSFIKKMAEQGFNIFKIKVGVDFDKDINRVISVCKIAAGAGICLDANCAYDANTAFRFIKTLEKYQVFPLVFEQPTAKEDYEGLKFLSGKLKMPVCADESVSSVEDAFKIIKNGYANAINIKLMKFGLASAREIYNLARIKNVKLMMGEMLESSLSSLCAAHFAGGLGGFDFIDLDTPFFVKDKIMSSGAIIKRSGIYEIDKVKKGIGVKPNLAIIKNS